MNILNFFIQSKIGKTNTLIPSPINYNDIPMGAITNLDVKVPLSYYLPFELIQKDQGPKPECATFSGTTLDEFIRKVYGEDVTLDYDWLYNECKKIDGLPYDSGTYFRVVLSILKNKGCKVIGGDPNDLSAIAKYKIAGYLQVNCTPDEIRKAIYQYGTVLMGFRGSNLGWMNGYIRAPKDGEVMWGHATTGIGYDETYIKGQNSWGKSWGVLGKFFIPNDYMPFECWAVIKDLPPNWETLIPDPKTKPKYQFKNQLFYGLNNEDVKMLQDCLKWIGCMPKDIVSIGVFGPKTLEAVKLFQLTYGISQTGNVGPLTLDKLNNLFN